MINEKISQEYKRWQKMTTDDKDIQKELSSISDNAELIEDAFFRNLEFGTGGLRGIIGAGPNRVNIYTIAKASQGLANYIKRYNPRENYRIAVSYDSRIKSDLFAKITSEVFAANGFGVYLYDELMPTPCLSFAVRELQCIAGIMITASHNSSEYNGYKVYNSDGCQITAKEAQEITAEIENTDIFYDIKQTDFYESFKLGKIQYVPPMIFTKFIEKVKEQSMLTSIEFVNRDSSIIYSPLNGTGLKPVLRVLKECNYTNIIVVEEQKYPNGNFPTCSYPNPETKEAMSLGIEYAKKYNADLFLATDPDCDRVGVVVKKKNKEYVLLSGNETGLLLLEYICNKRKKNGTMPECPVMIKTIVTTDMAEQIAEHYGVKTINVLTGFKFIGEQIGLMESKKEDANYIFGFEESCGYLSGTYVRDKDAVNAVFLICEMFSYYQSKGITLWDKLQELYTKYGYYLDTLYSYPLNGIAGLQKSQYIMQMLRNSVRELGKRRVIKCLDYLEGLENLPKSNVLKFILEGNCSVVVRPSGTEPKIKIYISVCAENDLIAKDIESELKMSIKEKLALPCGNNLIRELDRERKM